MTEEQLRHKYVDQHAVIELAKMIGETDIIDFLHDHGNPIEYHDLIRRGQRKGQAFFNALSSKWRTHLRGVPQDPFYSDYDYSVALAVAWLTAQEIANES